jgi:ribosome biogenesis GTPase A
MGFWPVVKKVVNESDVVLEIMDARMPKISRNDEVEDLIKLHKKILIKVYTKIDLVSKDYLNFLKAKEKDSVFVSGARNIGMRKLKEKILISSKRAGIAEPMIGIVGYPNVGKSAIINALAKRARAKVSNKAGTTRGIQWVNAGSLRILDSPGVVPWSDDEIMLGILGAKNPERLRDPESVALEIIKMFLDYGKENLEKFYKMKIGEGSDKYDILLEIGRARGFLLKGNRVDEHRTIFQVIRDWRDGKLRL